MRRGVTLVEVLVSLVVLVVVATMAMQVFRSQHQNWKSESDRAEVGMMALGTIDEISRAVRMTGGGMPRGAGGIKTWAASTPGITFVVNRSRGIDTVRGYTYLPTSRKLQVALDSAGRFSDSGYALLTVRHPATVGPAGTPSVDELYRLPILERVDGGSSCGRDSLVLDARVLANLPNNWSSPTNILVASNTLVYNIDSLSFRKSNDTLYTWANRAKATVFALGIDSFRVQYRHPVAGWSDALSNTTPAKAVDMVRIRVVMRNRVKSQWLQTKDPSSKGYRYTRLETEVGLRNDSLVNQ